MIKYILREILNIPEEFPIVSFFFLRLKSHLNLLTKREDFFKLYKNYRYNQDLKPDQNITIDVAICCVDKDIDVLPHCIDSVKKFISHDIDMIYLIAPKESIKLRDIAKSKNCIFIDEDSVINFKKDEIKLIVNGVNRSGWIFQQLLKLHVDQVSSKEYIFVIDADTILTRPKALISGGKTIFDFSDEFHLPYYKSFEKLTGLKHKIPISLVSHMMLFEKSGLKAFRNHVENKFQIKFVEAILRNLDRNETSGFSEFETYGNFYLISKRNYKFKYWYNISHQLISERANEFTASKTNNFNSKSFHSYERK